MTIFTVPISGVTPNVEVYGGLTAATTYVATLLGKPAATWRALIADDQARTLVAATRFIDQQSWPGLATGLAGGTPTTLQWPRSGVFVTDGTGTQVAVDPTVVPPDVVAATFELAALVAVDPTITSKVDTGSNVKRADAGGGVGVEFFNPTSAALGTATTMPAILMRLLGKFLSGVAPGSDVGGFGQSGNSVSDFSSCARIAGRSWPY